MKYLLVIPILISSWTVSIAKVSLGIDLLPGLSFTKNSNFSTSSYAMARAGAEMVLGPSLSGNVAVSYQRSFWWVETGCGIVRTYESHKIQAPSIFGKYKNVNLPFDYLFVPLKFGVELKHVKRFSFSPFLGVNILAESIGGPKSLYENNNQLETKDGSKYQGTYEVYQNDMSYSGISLCFGFRSNIAISNRSSFVLGIEFNKGLSVLNDNVVSVTENRDGSKVNLMSFGGATGDAVGVTVGYRFRVW